MRGDRDKYMDAAQFNLQKDTSPRGCCETHCGLSWHHG